MLNYLKMSGRFSFLQTVLLSSISSSVYHFQYQISIHDYYAMLMLCMLIIIKTSYLKIYRQGEQWLITTSQSSHINLNILRNLFSAMGSHYPLLHAELGDCHMGLDAWVACLERYPKTVCC